MSTLLFIGGKRINNVYVDTFFGNLGDVIDFGAASDQIRQVWGGEGKNHFAEPYVNATRKPIRIFFFCFTAREERGLIKWETQRVLLKPNSLHKVCTDG